MQCTHINIKLQLEQVGSNHQFIETCWNSLYFNLTCLKTESTAFDSTSTTHFVLFSKSSVPLQSWSLTYVVILRFKIIVDLHYAILPRFPVVFLSNCDPTIIEWVSCCYKIMYSIILSQMQVLSTYLQLCNTRHHFYSQM